MSESKSATVLPAPRDTRQHEQHRVLSIRGKSFCNSNCVFCVEKQNAYYPISPKVDETRNLILANGLATSSKYNMLFFMNGEPSLHPKIFEYVELAKANGFQYFGMSSHFRAFADPYFALKILEAGFEFFDISLHASSYAGQDEINPIGDEGKSLKEALHGLRNLYELSRRRKRKIGVSHKAVITRLNYKELLPLFRSTYNLGVRVFILQPVKTTGLPDDLQAKLAINEDEFMPYVNDLLRETEGLGSEIKLYGMSQIGAYQSKDLIQEQNLIKHAIGKRSKPAGASFDSGDRLIPSIQKHSTAAKHAITVRLPTEIRPIDPNRGPDDHRPEEATREATFECAEDQYILNAALGSGLSLPFGCRMASCGSCCARVISGEIDRAEQGILTDEQVAEGYALLCRSHPKSNLVILGHQEDKLGL